MSTELRLSPYVWKQFACVYVPLIIVCVYVYDTNSLRASVLSLYHVHTWASNELGRSPSVWLQGVQ